MDRLTIATGDDAGDILPTRRYAYRNSRLRVSIAGEDAQSFANRIVLRQTRCLRRFVR